MQNNDLNVSSRRGFLGTLATGAAALGVTTLATPFSMMASPGFTPDEITGAEEWFNKIKGKHRIVFDATEPHDIFPFAWPRVFLLTNAATGTVEKDCSVVVVLRHAAIPYAMEDKLWAKYNFGEMFKAEDPATKQPAMRNPFWKPKPGDFKIPGIGNVSIGINELQDSGVMFCVCDAAMTVYSAIVAGKMNMEPADVKKEWVAGLLPNIPPMPSGVWAVNRAQEKGCSYCFVR
ncbi:twin-arginine translocation signal domain-containing protein [Pseudoflavitalea sp. X16]|uniref:twin-arginine translocation signal domain-containing protein n=1 Tax=Paraflavitalea devenefica TaxID=2716334 RepID=UPI00141FBA89|nr:twin-arginine translocation signal domain-containing protein [Paraflavitalea devenefica]NII24660.1 twin-arginine translocation signal domain-containing protein [Paraflavitalea devenefica]